MNIKRKDHWELHLHNHIESRVEKPFVFGSNDCALFVCDGVMAMTGTNIAGDFRGKYTTQLGASRLAKRVASGPSIEDVAVHVTAQYEMEELPSVKLAHRGDVVLFDGAEGPALGLVYLNGTHAVFVGEGGLRKIEISQCRRAWRVSY